MTPARWQPVSRYVLAAEWWQARADGGLDDHLDILSKDYATAEEAMRAAETFLNTSAMRGSPHDDWAGPTPMSAPPVPVTPELRAEVLKAWQAVPSVPDVLSEGQTWQSIRTLIHPVSEFALSLQVAHRRQAEYLNLQFVHPENALRSLDGQACQLHVWRMKPFETLERAEGTVQISGATVRVGDWAHEFGPRQRVGGTPHQSATVTEKLGWFGAYTYYSFTVQDSHAPPQALPGAETDSPEADATFNPVPGAQP